MARLKALKGVNYLGYATTQRSFEFQQHINEKKGKGYVEQDTKGTFEFAYMEEAIGDPNLLVFKIEHYAKARFHVKAKKTKDDPVIFQVLLGIDMIYEIPISDKEEQKKLKSYKWYFADCAKPLLQMAVTDLLKDTGYKMR